MCDITKRFAILIALDQLVNAMCGGWPDETLSSRAHRARLAGRAKLANAIDLVAKCFGDTEHCKNAYENERARMQLAPEMRG